MTAATITSREKYNGKELTYLIEKSQNNERISKNTMISYLMYLNRYKKCVKK